MIEPKKACVTSLQSPIGTIGIGYKENTVLCIEIGKSVKSKTKETLQALGYSIEKNAHPTGEILERELMEYFEGGRKTFTVKPEFTGTPFQVKVWKTLYKVPFGALLSYSELAAKSGRPKAARAVGMIMGQNRIPIIVPCHRIIAANGGLGGFGCGLDVKEKLLGIEGHHKSALA